MYVWHQEAAEFANRVLKLEYGGFYEPGTERFDSLLNLITSRTSFVEGAQE